MSRTRDAIGTRTIAPHLGQVAPGVGLSMVLAACANAPQTTLAPLSDVGREQLQLERTLFYIGLFVFLLVEVFLFWTIYRYRDRGGTPTVSGGESPSAARLELAWTLVPVMILGLVAVPTVRENFRTQPATAARSALPVEVIGHQWWWEFRYPTLDVVTANELHLPAGVQASLTLTSADVMHGFWLPRLGGKRDVLPGRLTKLVWTPDEVGSMTPGQCTQFCGVQHGRMAMLVVIESRSDFDRWAAAQRTVPPTPSRPGSLGGAPLAAGTQAALGEHVFATNACIGCHTIAGVSGGQAGPDLTHLASRTTLAGGTVPNTPENLARWIRDPQEAKPGALMPRFPLDSLELRALVAYLDTLH